jgi:hypothetical protein
MALPKLENPIYTLELPSTGEEIKFRPFLVKEQKMLLLAQGSNEQTQINDTISALIDSCTFGKLNAKELPIFDIEYLFCKLRAKSVGEKAKIFVTCKDDGKTKVPVDIDLDNIDIQMTENHTNKINIKDDVSVVMGYPTLQDIKTGSNEDEDASMMFDMICNNINEVHDGDKVMKKIDFNKQEITEFVESMSSAQMGKLMDFFKTMPKLRKVVKVMNPNTKVESEVMLEGLNNFL